MSDTVYIKISQSTEVHEPEVRVKDIAQVHCRNKAAEARIKALKVTSFKERDREASYVGSVMDLEPEVRVKDIAQVHCRNKAAEARIKALKVTSFKERDREASYVGSVMDLLEELEGTGSSIQINSVGETDFIVSYNPQIKRRAALQWMKTAVVSAVSFCGAAFAIMTFNNDANVTDVFGNLYRLIMGAEPQAVSFCGAAFAIMTFNNDANVTDVFGNLYRLIMGAEPQGITVLEISYSVGLSLGILVFFNHFASWKMGILVFFNHFASWKITVDPTPIEVEMRLYEENLDKALIQNAGRKEAQTDVR